MIRLAHSKVELALHELRGGGGQPLLLLHGLGERSPKEIPLELSGWPGPLYALDFTGHGDSTLPLLNAPDSYILTAKNFAKC